MEKEERERALVGNLSQNLKKKNLESKVDIIEKKNILSGEKS